LRALWDEDVEAEREVWEMREVKTINKQYPLLDICKELTKGLDVFCPTIDDMNPEDFDGMAKVLAKYTDQLTRERDEAIENFNTMRQEYWQALEQRDKATSERDEARRERESATDIVKDVLAERDEAREAARECFECASGYAAMPIPKWEEATLKEYPWLREETGT